MLARVLKVLLGVVVAVVVLAIAAALVLTNTDWGRERVRRVAMNVLQGKAHGIVRVGRVTGNLLTGATVHDLSITDSAGHPFLAADSVRARYSLVDLYRRHLELRDMLVVRPVIVLEKPPGGQWNYLRIFPRDTTTPPGQGPSFTDWMVFHDVRVVQGHVIVRSPWSPKDELSPAERDSVVRAALGGESRLAVVRVPGGFEKVSEFRQLDAMLPLMRLAKPGTTTRLFDVATLQTTALPFRPPAAEVRDLRGTFELTTDSLWFRGARAALPGTRIDGDGRYGIESGDLWLKLHGDPVALASLRWIYPRIPSHGTGAMDFALDWTGDDEDYQARNATVQVDRQRVAGDFGISFITPPGAQRDTFAFHDTKLTFANVDTRLLEQLFPFLHSPRRGLLTGRAAARGGKHRLWMDGDFVFDDAGGTGRSRLLARGELGAGVTGGFHANELRLEAAPVQVALARVFITGLPIGGILRGTATLDGSTLTMLTAVADLTHAEDGALSRVTGTGRVRLAGAAGGSPWVDVDARLHPLSLVTVGRFAPSLGLRGSAAGPVHVTGSLRDMTFRSTLALGPGGGELAARGRVDLASPQKGYEAAVGMRVVDLHSILASAPVTALSARAQVAGRGTDPATMRLAAIADVSASRYDSLTVDTASVRIGVADGLLRVDTLLVHGPHVQAAAGGSFGLAAGRSGELTYTAAVDSLGALARWLPRAAVDTGVVRPRPWRVRRALARARADSARIAERTEVERAVQGGVAPRLVVDTAFTVRRDSVAGAVYAAGVARGSLTDLDLRGRAGATGLALRGNTARALRVEYAWTHGRTPVSSIAVAAQGDSLSAAGFALDSADARLTFSGASHGGHAQLYVWQDTAGEYSVRGDYVLHAQHNELHLADVALRFDTTVWRSTHPSAIRWGAEGVQVENVELRNGTAGRVYANGLLPTSGSADLQVAIDNFQAGDFLALLQSDVPFRGLVSVDGRLQGVLAAPRMRGAFGVTEGSYGGTPVPELHGTLDYAGRRLTAHVEAARAGGTPMMVADARLPINLALTGVTRSRLLRRRPLVVDVTADSLPLELIPRFTDVVADVHGRSEGIFHVRGTFDDPRLAGVLALDRGHVTLVPTGTSLSAVAGYVRMAGDSVWVDSLVGRAGGPVRLSGRLGVATLTRPSFDLLLTATNARVLDNDRGRVNASAEITMKGPFDAAVVNGTATVNNGVIYIPTSTNKQVINTGDPSLFNVIDTSVVANRELLPAQSPLLQNLRMDLTVQVNRGTWARNTDANVELFTGPEGLAIHVDRAKQALTLDGVVSTDRGEYTYLGKRFQIRNGSATFIGAPELNPMIQATAAYDVQLANQPALTIEVLIGGTLRSPRLTLQSSAQPPLPQSDLISYLAFGRPAASLLPQANGTSVSGANTNGTLVGTTEAFVQRQLAGVAIGAAVQSLETSATRSMGLDVFNITPAGVPIEFNPDVFKGFFLGSQVEMGKYLNPRTFLSLQVQPSNTFLGSVPGIHIEHRLTGGRWNKLNGIVLDGSLQTRYRFAGPPTLDPQAPTPSKVFGAFVIREWRF